MKIKIFLIAIMVCALLCAFAICINADGIKKFETDEFQTGDNITYLEGVNVDAYVTDTGRNNDITEWVDNDKYFSRVVIKNSDDTYTTYPAWYVFTFRYDWQGSYQESTVERLNALSDVTGETYEISDIIRIEYLEFNEAGLKVARKGTETPKFFPNAKYVRIPSHYTSISFFNAYEVETIEFAPDCKITKISKAAILNCYKLKAVILPNTVTEVVAEGINFYSKQETSAMQILNLGASITTLGGKNAVGNCRVPGIRVILSDTLDGGTYNYEYFPNNAVVLFTGTKAQAEKFGFTHVYSYDEYVALGSPDGAKGNTIIVYGYNKCEAFYGGEHEELTQINGCQYGCSRCGEAVIIENPQHELKMSYNMGENGYFDSISIVEACKNCGTKTIDVVVEAIFAWKGYSKSTFGETYAVVQGFHIDREALAQYKVYAPDFDFGIMATGNASGEAIKPQIGDEKVFTAIFDNTVNDYYDIKVTGITEELIDKNIVFCIYVLDGGRMYYLDGEKTADTVVGVSYNNIIGG